MPVHSALTRPLDSIGIDEASLVQLPEPPAGCGAVFPVLGLPPTLPPLPDVFIDGDESPPGLPVAEGLDELGLLAGVGCWPFVVVPSRLSYDNTLGASAEQPPLTTTVHADTTEM